MNHFIAFASKLWKVNFPDAAIYVGLDCLVSNILQVQLSQCNHSTEGNTFKMKAWVLVLLVFLAVHQSFAHRMVRTV